MIFPIRSLAALALMYLGTTAAAWAQDPAASVRARRDTLRAVSARAASRFFNRQLPASDRISAVRGLSSFVSRAHADSALRVGLDDSEVASVRTTGLRLGTRAANRDTVAQARLIALVVNPGAPLEVRRAAMTTLDEVLLTHRIPNSESALRVLVTDIDPELRSMAIGRLALWGDSTMKRRLVAGIRDSTQALVSVETALGLLSAHPDSSVISAARQVLSGRSTVRAQKLALRLAAMDSVGLQSVVAFLRDRRARDDLRVVAARAIAANSPSVFADVSLGILEDENESVSLRVALIEAHRFRPGVLDSARAVPVAASIGRLATRSRSPQVRAAASRFTEERRERG